MSQVVKTYSNIFDGLVHIFRCRWEAQDRNETKVERGYIVEEARTLFRENKELEDEQEIRLRMMEAEARLTMAEHYGERGQRCLRKMTDLGLVTILRGMIHCILVFSVAIFPGNPYPRPVNLPKTSYSKREGKKVGKAIQKMNEISRPVYIRSTDDAIKTADS